MREWFAAVRKYWLLKKKLETMPENRGHLYNTTGKPIDEIIREIVPEHWLLRQ